MIEAAELTWVRPALRGFCLSGHFLPIKMAEATLVFSATKTSFDPQVQGCLIIGQPRHLQAVTFDHFAEKLSRRVDTEVRSIFYCYEMKFIMIILFSF